MTTKISSIMSGMISIIINFYRTKSTTIIRNIRLLPINILLVIEYDFQEWQCYQKL